MGVPVDECQTQRRRRPGTTGCWRAVPGSLHLGRCIGTHYLGRTWSRRLRVGNFRIDQVRELHERLLPAEIAGFGGDDVGDA